MENLSVDYNEWTKRVKENISDIKERMAAAAKRSGRNVEDVRLLAATKTVPAEIVKFAVENGIDLIGENRVQEFVAKYDTLKDTGVTQHFIGHLQTNKVKKLIGGVTMIESVGSLHLAETIDSLSRAAGLVTDILVEVNIGSEYSKSGVAPSELDELLTALSKLDNIRVMGLMAIPPICEGDEVRKYFKYMKDLFDGTAQKNIPNITMKYLSMGMSGDFEIAIEEGANIIRVGSSIFGKRNY